MSVLVAGARTRFTLPDELSAPVPAEARGLRRDHVRLLVATPDGVYHERFSELPRYLRPGDVLVVNDSGTVAAAVDGEWRGGQPVTVHFAGPAPAGDSTVELRRVDQSGPVRDARPGERVRLPAGAVLRLLAPVDGHGRLWRARLRDPEEVPAYLFDHGRPISYAYLRGRWPLDLYQTVFARVPGSAEMPSAGRPFTTELVTALAVAGIRVTAITLHTGVSSAEAGEAPQPERYAVPAHTAELVNLARERGRRVVAVGTTVARALETVAAPDGRVTPGAGWTDLVLGPDRPVRAVDGLVTGFHAPEASHLLLLEAVAGAELVQRAYDAAVRERYLWHEFGDSCLLLPDQPGEPAARARR